MFDKTGDNVHLYFLVYFERWKLECGTQVQIIVSNE